MSICVCVCNSVCQYVPLYACPSVSPGVYLCLGKHRCLYVSVYIMCLYIHLPVPVCVCMSVCVCVRVMRPGARSRAEQSWWLLVSAGPGQSHPGPINKSGPAAAPSHPPGPGHPRLVALAYQLKHKLTLYCTL